MLTIIAGSRAATKEMVYQTIQESGFDISVVVSGKAPTGGDYWGEIWAAEKGFKVIPFFADWYDFSEPCVIKTNRFGKPYNKLAGFNRNERMAIYTASFGGGLIATLLNQSPGTLDMIERANKHNLKVFVKGW